ncbi:MAG: FKBP-type peptidyl-prolyl cis-trans isomerase [Cytophagales bacterium]
MKYLNILVLTLIIISSCTDKEKVLDNGVKLTYFKNGTGNLLENGELLELNIKYFDHEGNEQFNSEEPILQQKDSLWENVPFLNVLGNLKVGDSVFFQLSVDDFLGYIPGAEYPDSIGSELMSFYAGIQNIMSREEFENKQREEFEKMKMNDDQQLSIDLELIDNYLKENNIDAVKTESGLRYVIEKTGQGENAAPGDNVSVHYTGMLLDGEKFDSSLDRGDPLNFTLGQGMVIRGWDEGITYFNKNSKGTIYIPSSLGYGASGAGGVIPPNAVLVFEIELIDY